MRWIISPLVSSLSPHSSSSLSLLTSRLSSATQAEMNCYWEGTFFTLADRYTELSKILFISLFYSFLVPFGLFVSTVACLVLFAVDRYLLFRKTKPPPMLDATMASSVLLSLSALAPTNCVMSDEELSHLRCWGSHVCHNSTDLQVASPLPRPLPLPLSPLPLSSAMFSPSCPLLSTSLSHNEPQLAIRFRELV
jgi:hypothetical protein